MACLPQRATEILGKSLSVSLKSGTWTTTKDYAGLLPATAHWEEAHQAPNNPHRHLIPAGSVPTAGLQGAQPLPREDGDLKT